MDVSRLVSLTGELLDDQHRRFTELTACADAGHHSQFWARTTIRSLFALVEATVYEFKLLVLDAARHGVVDLTNGEMMALREETFELGNNGQVSIRSKFIKPEQNLRFTFSLMARVFGPAVALNLLDHRFADFKACLAVRNRLMHPKTPADINVRVAESRAALNAFLWFEESLQAVIHAMRQLLGRPQA